jgi:hypothetical protein
LSTAAAYAFIKRHKYGVVSSISKGDKPQSALVGIAVTPEVEIVFDTLKSARKYQNLVERPHCSLVIGWEAEQTLQLEGVAFEPEGAELRRYQEVYFSAWPDGRARMDWSGIAYFVVRPSWIRYSDYGRTPPWIEEVPCAFPTQHSPHTMEGC